MRAVYETPRIPRVAGSSGSAHSLVVCASHEVSFQWMMDRSRGGIDSKDRPINSSYLTQLDGMDWNTHRPSRCSLFDSPPPTQDNPIQTTTMQLFTTLAIIATAAATASAAHINGVMYSQSARGLMQHSICLDNEGCLSLHAEAPMEDVEAHRQLALTHAAKNASAAIAPKTSTKGVVCWGPCCAKCHYYRHLMKADGYPPRMWAEGEDDEEGSNDTAGEDDEETNEDAVATEVKCVHRAWGIECDKH